jgi:hypothetical protein
MTRPISEIYAEYRIPPWLQMHMYRVAAVAATLFDATASRTDEGVFLSTDREDLMTACLLHDMGNIIKFDFTLALHGSEQEADWKSVQQDFFARYGHDEHHATIAIMRELGVSERSIAVVDTINFMHCVDISKDGDLLVQIAQYADSRVVPSGIASLAERMSDMYIRYAHKHPETSEETKRQVAALQTIEHLLFEHLTITPEYITESSVSSLRDSLRDFPIAQNRPLR